MPRVLLVDPWGQSYHCDTRSPALLSEWFDEILPQVNRALGQRDIPPARIQVWPLFRETRDGRPADADWHTDSRALGTLEPFPAINGEEGTAALSLLWRELAVRVEEANRRQAEREQAAGRQ